jgi:hypothetical protein
MPSLPGAVAQSLQQPVFQNASNIRGAAGTASLDPGKPVSSPTITNSGLLVAIIAIASTADTVATPAGWTLPTNGGPKDTTGGAALRAYVMTAPTNVAGTSFTKTGTAGAWRVSMGCIYRASATDDVQNASTAANGPSLAIPSATASVVDTLSFVLFAYSNTSAPSPITGFTESFKFSNVAAPADEACYRYNPASGTVTAGNVGIATNCGIVGFHVVCKG